MSKVPVEAKSKLKLTRAEQAAHYFEALPKTIGEAQRELRECLASVPFLKSKKRHDEVWDRIRVLKALISNF